MPADETSKPEVPVLTDVVTDPDVVASGESGRSVDRDALIAELQTELAANAYALAEHVLHTAFAEMEATLFEQITARLRRELPELIDGILREHLGEDARGS